MKIGSVATVNDLPVYVYHDTDGEQIAMPCAERMFSERQAVQVSGTGINPVLSIRGRPEVRLGGFASLRGSTLSGRWAPVDLKPAPAAPPPVVPVSAAPAKPPPSAQTEPSATTQAEVVTSPAADDADLDSLLASLGNNASATEAGAAEPQAAEPRPVGAQAAEPAPADDDLDALLASLNAKPPPADENGTEADLDALLASLK
jgi:type VI secretion system protein ImpC